MTTGVDMQEITHAPFKVGDRVVIVGGAFEGCRGYISTLRDGRAADLRCDGGGRLTVPFACLRHEAEQDYATGGSGKFIYEITAAISPDENSAMKQRDLRVESDREQAYRLQQAAAREQAKVQRERKAWAAAGERRGDTGTGLTTVAPTPRFGRLGGVL